MTPVEFSQANVVLAKDQPEYVPLPVFMNRYDQTVPMTACFELSDEELGEIILTKRLWLTQLTFGRSYSPIELSTQNPFQNKSNT